MVVPTKRPSVLKEYRRLAPEYDRRWSFYIEATLRETLVRLRIQPRDHVLDVGCGTGMLLEQISAASPQAQLSGMDPSAEMLQIARGRLGENVNLHEGYAESLPFTNAAFDVVVSTNAFHYFRDPLGSLREIRRVLRPGGTTVITDWCDDYAACRVCELFSRLVNRAHVQIYGRDACQELLERAAFTAIRIDRYKINWLWGLMTAMAEKDRLHLDNTALGATWRKEGAPHRDRRSWGSLSGSHSCVDHLVAEPGFNPQCGKAPALPRRPEGPRHMGNSRDLGFGVGGMVRPRGDGLPGEGSAVPPLGAPWLTQARDP